ncbi:MAG: DUF998 domain-containing protein [Solirubrobacteraceae bacterium]
MAGVTALLALAVVLASLAYLHHAPTGLSPMRDAVSQYGISQFRAGYRVATIAFAIAGGALAAGIDRAVGGHGRAVVLALVVFAIARGAISWFPMDAPGTEPSATGHRHVLLAITAFAAATFAAGKLAAVLSSGRRWHTLAPVSTTLGAAMAACLIGIALARAQPALRARLGAIERAFYLCAIAWFAVFAVACATNAS